MHAKLTVSTGGDLFLHRWPNISPSELYEHCGGFIWLILNEWHDTFNGTNEVAKKEVEGKNGGITLDTEKSANRKIYCMPGVRYCVDLFTGSGVFFVIISREAISVRD